MIVWLFTILDMFVLLAMTLAHFGLAPVTSLLLVSAIYLGAKGLIFFGDMMSTIDLMAAIYILLMIIGLRTFFYYIFVGWFLYKLIFTIIQ